MVNSECADLGLFDYNGYDILVIPPSDVKKMQQELEALTPTIEEKILADNLIDNHKVEVMKIKDKRGTMLSSDEIRSYLSSIGEFRTFLNKVVEQQNHLILFEA